MVRVEGSIHHTLRISKAKVEFLGGWKPVSHKPLGSRYELKMRLFDLERAHNQKSSYGSEGQEISRDTEKSLPGEDASVLYRLGEEMTRAYLFGEAGNALRHAVTLAESQGASLRLALEIVDDDLKDLPWETLRLPEADDMVGRPLVLHPNVFLYRIVGGLGPLPIIQIPGPLRILVAVGSPEEINVRGELLDYEKELSTILDAVEEARRKSNAHVHILENGTVKAIRQANGVPAI